jgi:hypothetical protein
LKGSLRPLKEAILNPYHQGLFGGTPLPAALGSSRSFIQTSASSSKAIRSSNPLHSAHLLHDEKEVHKGGRDGGNVWDYCYDFALQAIQELLQSALVPRHPDIESVNSVFHFPTS